PSAPPSPSLHDALPIYLPPTVLPLQPDEEMMTVTSRKLDFNAELGALGYPGFSYHPARRRHNPAEVLSSALNEPDLDARVAEGRSEEHTSELQSPDHLV